MDGRVRAELVDITPQVSGRIEQLKVKDNQFVHRGDLLFTLDPRPLQIAVLTAESQLLKARSALAKAQHEAARLQSLPKNIISAEDLDTANLNAISAQATLKSAEAALKQANWQLQQTKVFAPGDGWVSNLLTRPGNYAFTGQAVFAIVDSHSFYVMGYFEETKLRHIHPGAIADIALYSDDRHLQGTVESIGHVIYDQSLASDSGLIPNITPCVPWVRLAQRIPVRIRLNEIPKGLILVAGTTCTITIQR